MIAVWALLLIFILIWRCQNALYLYVLRQVDLSAIQDSV